jgi:hypothetical protein
MAALLGADRRAAAPSTDVLFELGLNALSIGALRRETNAF